MSNPLAIAAVTATLRNLLARGITPDPDLADTTITLHPPDQARSGDTNANQINLFLYHTSRNAAWCNLDIPTKIRSNETGQPPLALNLFYLLTTYGRDNDAQRPFSHMLLGRAMSILHDHPVLGADEIAAALPNNDLGQQMERIRLTLQPMALDDLSKLWTAFQAEFRLSAAYEASVVLIDSSREARTPLPVLTRGPGDSGITAITGLIPPFPQITGVTPANAAELGDTLVISGFHLDGDTVQVQFAAPRLSVIQILDAAAGGTAQRVTVTLPAAQALPAGVYEMTVLVIRGTETRETNTVAQVIAPIITTALPMAVARQNGTATLTLGLRPAVRAGQTVVLLLGDRAIGAASPQADTAELRFTISNAVPDDYLVRVRIDGVDSNLLVDRTARPPVFDRTRTVTVQQ